jgi:hypothetical protein
MWSYANVFLLLWATREESLHVAKLRSTDDRVIIKRVPSDVVFCVQVTIHLTDVPVIRKHQQATLHPKRQCKRKLNA